MKRLAVLQYDIDMQGEHRVHFKDIRKILLSYKQMKELKNAKQTSYRNAYGVVVMMRGKGDVLVLAFGKGSKLQEKYPILQGSGKIVRHLYVKASDVLDEVLLREMIEESVIVGMEESEMKVLKRALQ